MAEIFSNLENQIIKQTLFDRPLYIEKLNKFKASPDLVKIITGIRRCGKSKLLEIFQNELITKEKVDPIQIISINLEDNIQTKKIGLTLNSDKRLEGYEKLISFIMDKMQADKMNYIFIDEVQLLENWQQAANTFRLMKNTDVYLTGSNAYMFSSDLANSFGGRYVEIKMQTLTFKEYISAYKTILQDEKNNIANTDFMFRKYIKESGFPQTINNVWDRKMIYDYLVDVVYNNTIYKDIVKRFNLKNFENLERVIHFLFDNIGSEISTTNIINSLKSAKHKISSQSIDTYLKGLIDSYLMYECPRYDIKGKKILTTNSKYYASDIGLRTVLLGREDIDLGHILENIIYLELINRGYRVFVGKIPKFIRKEDGKVERKTIEVDFVAQKPGEQKEYYQVAYYIPNEHTLDRELAPLQEIKDNYPKFLLSMEYGSGEKDGINRINIFDWLTK